MQELTALAREVAAAYERYNTAAGRPQWTVDNYMSGFVGDVGDLSKLVMAKSGLRRIEDVDGKLAHELADCLWSVLIIADELGIDLESAFRSTVAGLLARLS